MLCLAHSGLYSQATIEFSINQKPALTVDAGKDTTVAKGSVVKLGGLPSATGGSGGYVYAWTPATGLDTFNIANPIATIDTNITYTLVVSDSTGCSKSSQVSLTITPANGSNEHPVLQLYPNPTSGTLFVRASQPGTQLLRVEMFTIHGVAVHNSVITLTGSSPQKIQHSLHVPGVYIMKIWNQQHSFTTKVVIK